MILSSSSWYIYACIVVTDYLNTDLIDINAVQNNHFYVQDCGLRHSLGNVRVE